MPSKMLRGLVTQLTLILAAAGGLAKEPVPAAAAPGEINLRRTVVVEVVRKTQDAVVNISATKVAQRTSPLGYDPFWQMFDSGERVATKSLGSGFLIHSDGYVVTNHHVIDRAMQLQVELADGRKLPAEMVSSDSEADLAVLRIRDAAKDAKPFPSLELGDSSDLMIGEPVIAVGNPLGFSHSVSTGIVASVHRDLKDDNGRVMLKDLIQTDAAINPGNSGGPLLNAYGQVIGINTAIRGDAQNIGFSIQINRLRELIPELMSPLHMTKMEIPLALAERRRLTAPARVDCEVMTTGTRGQVVRAINGRRPVNIVDAYAILLRARPEQKTISVQLADGTERRVPVRPAPVPSTVVEARNRIGITIEPVTPMLAQRYRLTTGEGLFISEVLRETPGERAGLKPGDVIIQLGRYRVSNLNDFGNILQQLPEQVRVRVGILRGDRMGYTTLEL